MNPRSNLTLIVFTVILALGALSASAESVPKLINYQGKLTDSTGFALQDGEYSVRFALFDAPADGTLVWGEIRTVSLVKGVFNVALGGAGSTSVDGAAVNDLAFAFGDTERYLETTIVSGPGIGGEQTLAPRQQMASVPYAVAALHGVPPGTVAPFAGVEIPEGWVRCDGSSYPTDDARYTALHEAIQGVYGTGDGTFAVPDLRGRAPIGNGKGDTWMPGGVDQSTDWLLGQKFGTEKHQLSVSEMPSHNHGVNDPGHSHQTNGKHNVCTGCGFVALSDDNLNGRRSTRSSKTGITIQNRGGEQPHNNMQPSLVLNYIIKL